MKVDGVEGTEVDVVAPKTVTRCRVVQSDGVIYTMKFEVPGQELSKPADAAATKVFESFKFPTPEAEEAPAKTAMAG